MRSLGIAVTLVLVAPSAGASNRQARDRAARKSCLSGDYNKGIEILADLFVETQDAIYIFNQGRCFEQNQQYKDAIARFQEFLRTDAVRALKPEDKASAESHIASCKQSLAEQVVPGPTSPPPVVVAPPPAPMPAPEPAQVIVVQPDIKAAPANPGLGLRITGIVLASLGVAGLGAGVGLNLLANKKISDMESRVDGYSDGESSSQKGYVTLAWVGYGVGTACLATGAILYGVGLSARSKSSDKVALVPTLGPGQAGASLVGAF
jgi:tetratricopeptide (TPR) repeat protein